MSFDLTDEFNSITELKKLNHDNDVNILMGGTGISNHMSLQAILANNRNTIEKKHKEFIERILELTYQQILDNIREAQMQIADAVNRMNEVINQSDEHITRIHKKLQNITHRHRELNDAIEAKHFEKGADGNYHSKAVADSVATYERRTGEKLADDISPDMLITILKAQQRFEKDTVIPALESKLVKLTEFRDGVQIQKETFEEENERITKQLKAIDADTSLSDEERRSQKTEILEQASEVALDAQMAAHSTEAEFTEIIAALRESKHIDHDPYYGEQANEENPEINQSALEELQTIKPMLIH